MRFFLTVLLIVRVAPAVARDRTLQRVMLSLAGVGSFEHEESRATVIVLFRPAPDRKAEPCGTWNTVPLRSTNRTESQSWL